MLAARVAPAVKDDRFDEMRRAMAREMVDEEARAAAYREHAAAETPDWD
jgi:hypothetical protein